MRPDASLSDQILDQIVTGLRLEGETLGEAIAEHRTLMVFLRHLG